MFIVIALAACSQPLPSSTPSPVNAEADETINTTEPPETPVLSTATLRPTNIPITPTHTPSTPALTHTPQPTDIPPTPLPPTFTPSSTPIPNLIEQQGIAMTLVDAGRIVDMGAEANDLLEDCRQLSNACQRNWFTRSEPVHTVFLSPFYIDIYEVTTAQFAIFLNELDDEGLCLEHDCLFFDDSRVFLTEEGEYTVSTDFANLPVSGTTWYGAAAYCEWRGGRLPTEAEWEIAASWDAENLKKNLYPWGNEFVPTAVNYCDINCYERHASEDADDGFAFESPVGSFDAGRSPFGSYDMAGNLWEWTADWFSANYYKDAPTVNPAGPETGTAKVVRGGSWKDTGNFTNSVIRFSAPPDETSKTIGFRCAINESELDK